MNPDSNPVHLLVSSKLATFPSQKSPSLTRVKKRCQHMPPQFRNDLFCSEITPTSIQSHASYPVNTAYPVQLAKTLLCPWPFAFHPHKPNAPIHLSSFCLPRLGHKYYALVLHWQQISIGYSTSFLPSSAKNPRSSCSNGGHQALRRGSF